MHFCVCFAGSRTIACIDSQSATIRHGACKLLLPSDSRSTRCKQCSSFRVSLCVRRIHQKEKNRTENKSKKQCSLLCIVKGGITDQNGEATQWVLQNPEATRLPKTAIGSYCENVEDNHWPTNPWRPEADHQDGGEARWWRKLPPTLFNEYFSNNRWMQPPKKMLMGWDGTHHD